MSKYHIEEEKLVLMPARYSYNINPEVIDFIYEQLLRKMIVEKRYRDPHYSAAVFAKEIGVDIRQVSATTSQRFHKSYTNLVNGYRIRYALLLMEDRRYSKKPVTWLTTECGFANRQTFYAAFSRETGMSPNEFRQKHVAQPDTKRPTDK